MPPREKKRVEHDKNVLEVLILSFNWPWGIARHRRSQVTRQILTVCTKNIPNFTPHSKSIRFTILKFVSLKCNGIHNFILFIENRAKNLHAAPSMTIICQPKTGGQRKVEAISKIKKMVDRYRLLCVDWERKEVEKKNICKEWMRIIISFIQVEYFCSM